MHCSLRFFYTIYRCQTVFCRHDRQARPGLQNHMHDLGHQALYVNPKPSTQCSWVKGQLAVCWRDNFYPFQFAARFVTSDLRLATANRSGQHPNAFAVDFGMWALHFKKHALCTWAKTVVLVAFLTEYTIRWRM